VQTGGVIRRKLNRFAFSGTGIAIVGSTFGSAGTTTIPHTILVDCWPFLTPD
jgi:hypothetical protein